MLTATILVKTSWILPLHSLLYNVVYICMNVTLCVYNLYFPIYVCMHMYVCRCVLNMQIKNPVIGGVILLSVIGHNLSIKA
jgi:hypothetical protein